MEDSTMEDSTMEDRETAMFGLHASIEPQRQWLRGDVALAFACAAGLLVMSVNDLGSGRRCP